ncbi:acyl-CoA dehydrogenase family protein [Pseudonocardia sp. C8]|uniref:acyl-CoA dehydrogenase family protein n=1 Tax=Pseudonocardia sp. C8 TaxID=2762759 RepID=UPI001642527C|nr:acyl-CoA dehydrogenase family protein [Pseudonocardia sp. C8]
MTTTPYRSEGTLVNYADRDPALKPMLDRVLSTEDRNRLEPLLDAMGTAAPAEVDPLARTADRHPPRHVPFSPSGDRIDDVEFHPAYDGLTAIAFHRFGLAAMSHRAGVNGWPGRAPHVVKYALSYLFVQAEFGVACPLSMTDSAARILRLFDPDRFAAEIDALSSTDPASAATGAMFMTEIDGGTDVGRTATEATDHGSHWTLRGRKWFCSNVTADVILTLARVPGQGEGTRGLGMFLVPRRRPDGSRNAIRIDRLKDKLGTRSMASGEVTLDDAWAQPVGDLSRGFRQMAEMVNVSRLSNAMRSAAIMRRAVREAVDHTRARIVSGRALFDQSLMRATLLPLLLDSEAALALVLECADRLDAADAVTFADPGSAGPSVDDDRARSLIRVLTPLAKYTVCKRARWVTGETMEIRGGNGYIEDWVEPRLLRDAHLGSIWEGSSNVIALDILRCLRKDGAHRLLAATYTARLDGLGHELTATAARRLAERWARLAAAADRLLGRPADEQEIGIAGWATDVAHTLMATLLLEQAEYRIGVTGDHRALLVAEAVLHRLDDPAATPGAALRHLGEIADGDPLPQPVRLPDVPAQGGLTRV